MPLSAPAHSSPLPVVVCRRPAMNTLFEIALPGDNEEHLAAAAEAALDEIERIERLLSRFDPSSEVSRVNREAPCGPVLIDYELLDSVLMCRDGWERTAGYFDITATSLVEAPDGVSFAAVQIDTEHRCVAFTHPGVRLDFGGFGKGYALDRAAALLRRYGVKQALLHGGTSSVLAIGPGPDTAPWRVGLRDPWDEDGCELAQVDLCDNALSVSAVFGNDKTSDIVDARTSHLLSEQAECVVVADTAARAEIFSTALLCMGEAPARLYSKQQPRPFMRAAWIAAHDERPQLSWLTGTNE